MYNGSMKDTKVRWLALVLDTVIFLCELVGFVVCLLLVIFVYVAIIGL